jgi:hypothetical protein
MARIVVPRSRECHALPWEGVFPVSLSDIHPGLVHWTMITPSEHDRNILGISNDRWLTRCKRLQNLKCVENMNTWVMKLNETINSLKSKLNGTINLGRAKQGEV